MKNLPTKDSNVTIECVVSPNKQLTVFNSNDYIVTEINMLTEKGLCADIAQAIIEARDIGFRQCQAHIRMVLGIKE